MKCAKSLSLAAALVVFVAAPAVCQESAPVSGLRRGYITAVGGAAVAGENTAMLAAEYGDTLLSNLQAYATFAYFDNLMNDSARARLDELGELLTVATGGVPWEFRGRDRAFAFSAGAKFVPGSASVRPYIGGGAGLINLKRSIAERTRGDITEPLLEGFAVRDGVFTVGQINTTKPLGEVSGGVVFLAGRAYIDVGYRYRVIFHSPDALRFGQFGVGVGTTF